MIIYDYKENNSKEINKNEDFIQSILLLYIKLLCITNKKEKILPCLKECSLFPIELCIYINYDVDFIFPFYLL